MLHRSDDESLGKADSNKQTDINDPIGESNDVSALVSSYVKVATESRNSQFIDRESVCMPNDTGDGLRDSSRNCTSSLKILRNVSNDSDKTITESTTRPNLTDHLTSSLSDMDHNAEEDVSTAQSSEVVSASVESISSTSNVLWIPRIQDFISDDEISFMLCSSGDKLDRAEDGGCKTGTAVNSSSVAKSNKQDLSNENLTPLKHDVTDADASRSVQATNVSSAQGLLGSPSDQSDGWEMLLSPFNSSGSLRSMSSKRKYTDSAKERVLKCRRLSGKKGRTCETSETNETSANNEIPQKYSEELLAVENASNSKIETYQKQVSLCGIPSNLNNHPLLCNTTSASDKLTNPSGLLEKTQNPNLTSLHNIQLTKSSDNDTEDEIVPPTPPVHVDHQPSSETAGDSRNALLTQLRNVPEESLFPDEIIENRDERKRSNLSNSFENLADDKEDDGLVSDEVKSPAENHLASSQEELLPSEDGPCDEGNIGLLRRLGKFDCFTQSHPFISLSFLRLDFYFKILFSLSSSIFQSHGKCK